jgi:hypothetical protein
MQLSETGLFAFPLKLEQGHDYQVAIVSHPRGQDCSIVDGIGVGGDNNRVRVMCDETSPHSYAKLAQVEQELGGLFMPSAQFQTNLCQNVRAPSTIAEMRQIIAEGIPVVLTNASHLFGKKLQQWASKRYLQQEYGSTVHLASVFPRAAVAGEEGG